MRKLCFDEKIVCLKLRSRIVYLVQHELHQVTCCMFARSVFLFLGLPEKEGKDLGQVIIDISIKDELEAEFVWNNAQSDTSKTTLVKMFTDTAPTPIDTNTSANNKHSMSMFQLGASDAG